jgi:dTDP-4-amino-4,6-dideoxygalactose transaminase
MARFDDLGYNLRLSDLQAAVGVAQMSKLERLLAHRRLCAQRYSELLALRADLALPPDPSRAPGHSYQSYVVRLREGGQMRRNAVMEDLSAADIATRPGTHAVHRLGYYAERYRLRAEDFPCASSAEDTSITLPLFPGMTEGDQQQVADALARSLDARR